MRKWWKRGKSHSINNHSALQDLACCKSKPALTHVYLCAVHALPAMTGTTAYMTYIVATVLRSPSGLNNLLTAARASASFVRKSGSGLGTKL